MKKVITIVFGMLLAVAAQAQNTMVVHVHNSTAQQFVVNQIDSLKWENNTTLRIFMHDKTTNDFAVNNVDSLTWLVTSDPEPPINVGEVSLGAGESFYINEEQTEVRAENCALRFSPTVVDENTKLVIRTATSAPPVRVEGVDPDDLLDISTNAVAIDADLGGIHELSGQVEIRIPISLSSGSVPGVAWYDESTNTWQPIDYDYDTRTREVVIWSNHLSTFECYEIKNEHTRNAQLRFFCMPDVKEDPWTLANILGMILDGYLAYEDFWSEQWGYFSQFGLDIGYNAVKAAGWENRFLEQNSEILGTVGSCFAAYDILRAGLSGDSEKAGINTMKLMLSKVTGAMSDAIGTSVMCGAMCAVAILDYALNKMFESAWEDRTDIYRRCYDLYYAHPRDGLPNDYRSARQWYDILLKAFTEGSPTVDGAHTMVSQIVDEYVNHFWTNLNEGDMEILWQEVGGPAGSFWGGINENMKKQLADNHKSVLYSSTLIPVFEAIGREMRSRSYEVVRKEMGKYCEFLNQVIRLDFKDASAVTSSAWAGCTVRFKELPNTILDPQKWEVKLNDLGKGTIRFRLYPYTIEGVKPILEVVGTDGSVLKEIPIVIAPGTTEIELGEGAQTGFNYKEATQLTTVNDPDGAYYQLYVETLDTEWDPNFYIDYLVWMFPLDTDMPSVFSGSPAIGVNGSSIGLNTPELQLEGTFTDPNNQKLGGSGTFTLTLDRFVTLKTKEQYEQWWRTDAAMHMLDLANLMLNGNVKRDITGTFTFEWSDEVNNYVFHFTGSGTYNVEGQRVSHLSNVDTMDGFAPYMNYPELKVVGTEAFILNGNTNIDYIVTYELKE